jgi:hypothetical protein
LLAARTRAHTNGTSSTYTGDLHVSFNLAAANLGIQILGVELCKMSSPSPSPAFVAHPLCPPHLRDLLEDTIQALDKSWLLPPIKGKGFESGKGLSSDYAGQFAQDVYYRHAYQIRYRGLNRRSLERFTARRQQVIYGRGGCRISSKSG